MDAVRDPCEGNIVIDVEQNVEAVCDCRTERNARHYSGCEHAVLFEDKADSPLGRYP